MCPYSYVTVAHEVDRPLLMMQARSMHLYLSPWMAREIIVIENPSRGVTLDWRDDLLEAYGDVARLVRFVRADELGAMPDMAGWWTQQILKLAAARIVQSPRYVVLDAKNHFVFPMVPDFLEDSVGTPKIHMHGYATHPLLPKLERTLAYFGQPIEANVARFTPTAPPFTLYTSKVVKLIEHMEMRERAPFAQAFQKSGCTEFFAYTAFLYSLGLKITDLYRVAPCEIACLWPEMNTGEHAEHAIQKTVKGAIPLFGVHRGAMGRFEPPARDVISAFWARRALVSDQQAGKRLLGAQA